jgi:hypothetical protein
LSNSECADAHPAQKNQLSRSSAPRQPRFAVNPDSRNSASFGAERKYMTQFGGRKSKYCDKNARDS